MISINSFCQKCSLTCLGSFIRRSICNTAARSAPRGYADEGGTTVNIMNKDEELGLMIDGYSQAGFKLNNRITILGPMVIFPRSVLSWNISDISQVNEDSLSIFKVLEPKIDILVLGTGDKVESHDLVKDFLNFSRKHRLSFEILPTESACATFNFLNAEGRNVVGAMIPPQTIRYTEDDRFRSKMIYDNVFDRRGA